MRKEMRVCDFCRAEEKEPAHNWHSVGFHNIGQRPTVVANVTTHCRKLDFCSIDCVIAFMEKIKNA